MLKYVFRRPTSDDRLSMGAAAACLLIVAAAMFINDEGPPISFIIFVIGTATLIALPTIWALIGYLRSLDPTLAAPLDPLEEKLRRVADALDQTRKQLEFIGSTVPELEAELRVKTAAIRSLQDETESLDRLAAAKRIDTAPIQELINQTVRAGQAQAARTSGRRERAYLLFGLAFSLPLGVLVNFIYDGVK